MYNKFFFDLLKKICYNIYVKKKKGNKNAGYKRSNITFRRN